MLKRGKSVRISGDNEIYFPGSGSWRAINNTWGKQGYINGRDFTQSVTIDQQHLPARTQIDWQWPGDANQGVLGYPEIMFGHSPFFADAPSLVVPRPKKLSEFTALGADFNCNIQGAPTLFNVAWDVWLLSAAGGGRESIVGEMMLWTQPGWHVPGDTPMRSIDADWYAGEATPERPWPIASAVRRSIVLSGHVDLLAVLRELAALSGLFPADAYVCGLEFGCEIARWRGGLTINSLAYTWQ